MKKVAVIGGIIIVWSMVMLVHGSFASSTPQVTMVKGIMPAVVGIGIDKKELVSYRFSDTPSFEEFKRFFNKEEKRFKEKSKPQWTDEKEITPENIQVVGSGFFIDKGGKVITAYHVIEGQKRVFVSTKEGEIYKAKVVREAPEDDLAILQIENVPGEMPFIHLGDSDAVEIAEPVMGIGNPFGLSFTVTSGIISALNRSLGEGSEGLIQTDAPLNYGNSGGPLINMNGEVIGINHAILDPSGKSGRGGSIGIGFAVPSNKAKQLLASAPSKGGTPPFLGIKLEDQEKGQAAIVHVEENSPAETSGLSEGDIIISVNEKKIVSAEALIRFIRGKKVGDTVVFRIWRGKRTLEIPITLGQKKQG